MPADQIWVCLVIRAPFQPAGAPKFSYPVSPEYDLGLAGLGGPPPGAPLEDPLGYRPAKASTENTLPNPPASVQAALSGSHLKESMI